MTSNIKCRPLFLLQTCCVLVCSSIDCADIVVVANAIIVEAIKVFFVCIKYEYEYKLPNHRKTVAQIGALHHMMMMVVINVVK